MRLSIVIPVYNAIDHLGNIIESLTRQSFDDYEIIFVDNNSTDGSYEFLSSLNNSKIKVFKEMKQGPSHARKFGFQKSQGEYIWFVDADDNVFNNSIEAIFSIIDEEQPEILICDFVEKNIELGTTSLRKGVFFTNTSKNIRENKKIVLVKPSLWNKIFKRNVLDLDTFIDSRIGEDMVVTVCALMKAKTISYLNKNIYEYSISSDGLTSSINVNNMKGIVITCSSLLRLAKEKGYYENFESELNYLVFTHLLYRMLRTVLIKEPAVRNECYDFLHNFLVRIPYKNSIYYKKSLHYRIGNYFIMNKKLFTSKFITVLFRSLFTNKYLNKLFKCLDK